MIDNRPDRLEDIKTHYKMPVALDDAIAYLNTNDLSEDLWIIPAVPVHVAFLWLLHQLQHSGPVHPMPVPDEVDAMIPNPYRVSSGTVYASFATFRCPDACSEPDDLCTHTRRPRLGSLFEHLARLQVRQYHMEVIRSWQLAPGVGGYRVAQLRASLERIDASAWKIPDRNQLPLPCGHRCPYLPRRAPDPVAMITEAMAI